MIFKRLTNSEDKIYEKAMELYSKSFPIYEQRLPEMRGRGYSAQALSFSASAKRRPFSKSTRRMTKCQFAARLFMSAPGTEPIRSSISTRRIAANIKATGSLS